MPRKYTKNTPFFELAAFKENLDSKKSLARYLVPEFLALTLLPNNEAINALQMTLSNSGHINELEINNQSQTLRSWMNTKEFEYMKKHVASPPVRNIFRQNLLNLASSHYENGNMPEFNKQQKIEHISLRAYPVRYETTQSTGRSGKRIIFVIYNFRRHWIFAHMAELADAMDKIDISEVNISPNVMAKGAWINLMQDICKATIDLNRRNSQPSRFPIAIVLHLPKDSGLSDKFKADNVYVIEDMPPLYSGKVKFNFKVLIKNSKQINEVYGENISNYGLKTFPDEIYELPYLNDLDHAEKDELIHKLWYGYQEWKRHFL